MREFFLQYSMLFTDILYLQTVDDAIAAGVDGYDADMKAAVQRSVKGLRLSKESAMAIASKAVRFFIRFVRGYLLDSSSSFF